MANAVERYLQAMAKLPPPAWAMERFVLEHGHAFDPSPLPARFGRPLRNGRCFINSIRATLTHGLTYVEGYACGIIPVLHAWCIDGDGVVLDFTWGEEIAQSYFGVPVSTPFLYDYTIKHPESGSVIDNWRAGWPMLDGTYKPEEWKP